MLLIVGAESGVGQSLRLALVSGDWVGLDLHARLATLVPGCRLIALGGATEAAIWSNAWETKGVPPLWTSIPYGYPLPNQKYRVVDARGRDCPDWVNGELWIGGAGVAAGYRADAELTAHKFVKQNGERWYRTGDMGRYWPDGVLEFLGRTDQQVKIRGHRIELGEIEAALEGCPDIARAIVVATGEKTRSLAAGVVARQDHTVDPEQLGAFLAERLPSYMIPERISVFDSLPLSANGKVDRKAIIRLLSAQPASSEEDVPQGAIELSLAQLWATLLELPHVDRRRNFFALGGDSLLATQMIEKLKRRFGLELSLRQLFTAPTVRDLAVLIAEQRPEIESCSMEEGVL
jgi:acyl-coenzyme A synthetase/AMP-(fatty) acid ligase/acyl carrier protein